MAGDTNGNRTVFFTVNGTSRAPMDSSYQGRLGVMLRGRDCPLCEIIGKHMLEPKANGAELLELQVGMRIITADTLRRNELAARRENAENELPPKGAENRRKCTRL
jgi:hypothetical protein